MQSVPVITPRIGLVEYARRHRYRLRNLHDGGPVPPARRPKQRGDSVGYVGASDRSDAIVGYDGYVADECEPGRLGIYLNYRSARGVRKAEAHIRAMGGAVGQAGDIEVAGTVPVERIEEALKLIRVSKLKPGQAENLKRGSAQNAHAA